MDDPADLARDLRYKDLGPGLDLLQTLEGQSGSEATDGTASQQRTAAQEVGGIAPS